jgi:hypothetical protein
MRSKFRNYSLNKKYLVEAFSILFISQESGFAALIAQAIIKMRRKFPPEHNTNASRDYAFLTFLSYE